MNLHYSILMAFIFDNLHLVNSGLVIFEKGVTSVLPNSSGLEFYVKLRNPGDDDYHVELSSDECCLIEDDGEDCGVLKIVGGCRRFLKRGTEKTLSLVAPIVNPYQRHGYCSMFLDYKATSDHKNKRNVTIIDFDTRVQKIDTNNRNLKICKEIDENPLNDCKPVNCESYYNGKRSYFDRNLKRCVKIPPCLKTSNPKIVYNPNTNKCIDATVTGNDIDYIKNLNMKRRIAKDVFIIENKKNYVNVTTENFVTEAQIEAFDDNTKDVKENYCSKIFGKCFVFESKGPFVLLGLVVVVQCCFIVAMFYCMTKSCKCNKEKKVVRKFFNYRQDASVTTPLINTSNNDTEIEDPFFSESTNVDQKIKCYKACQKEIANKVRPCMSDDILSKCLNRRDWVKHTIKPDEIPELNEPDKPISNENTLQDKAPESKVIFEDETEVKQKVVVNNISQATEVKTCDKDVEVNLSSEQEIRCHSYNLDSMSNTTGFKPSFTKATFQTKAKRGTNSFSTDKAAQAYFSNDSIDDFLSERGMANLAGENISNFFSESSIKPTSSRSSKTSKNFVKQVLSLFQKRSKYPLSDPGGKPKDSFDVQLIHMSKATVYSSSNDSEYGLRKQKDSRTSL